MLRLPAEGRLGARAGASNSTLSNPEALSNWKTEIQKPVLPREAEPARPAEKRARFARGSPHSTARLTPGLAARSAAVSAPPGTSAPPPQPPPWRAPSQRLRRRRAAGPERRCTCGPSRSRSSSGGGVGGAGLRDPEVGCPPAHSATCREKSAPPRGLHLGGVAVSNPGFGSERGERWAGGWGAEVSSQGAP